MITPTAINALRRTSLLGPLGDCPGGFGEGLEPDSALPIDSWS